MKAENDGVVTVTLDNTFSYMTSKTVHVCLHRFSLWAVKTDPASVPQMNPRNKFTLLNAVLWAAPE
jgi:hypothetical protein